MPEQIESPTFTLSTFGEDGDGVLYMCWRAEGRTGWRTGVCFWWDGSLF